MISCPVDGHVYISSMKRYIEKCIRKYLHAEKETCLGAVTLIHISEKKGERGEIRYVTKEKSRE